MNNVNLFPIGYDDFREVREKGYVFVDKSLLIRDILQESSKVVLITRPRRFGKTLNMSMLQYFFTNEIKGYSAQELFTGLKITQNPEAMAHQGQYPVIHLTLKGLKVTNYDELYLTLGVILSKLYEKHQIIYSSLSAPNKKRFQAILDGTADIATLKFSLKNLTEYLHRYYSVKPYLLIDEYDTPVLSGYLNNYYDQAIDLIRGLLSEALKGNDDLEKAILTGILRVAKEGMFSGLNNIKVYSILNPRYNEYFGFTQAEVNALLEASGFSAAQETVKAWYNGYQIGNTCIYNPWSIMYYLDEQGVYGAYWLDTSDNLWIQELLIRSNIDIKIGLEQLLQGQTIKVEIPNQFAFADLEQNDETLWSLLVMSGYLTVIPSEYAHSEQNQNNHVSRPTDADTQICYLAIPNFEVRATYSRLIRRWLTKNRSSAWYGSFMRQLLHGDIHAWSQRLQEVMLQIISYHDTAKYPEAFYHGLLLGIVAYLHETGYIIKSNRESGQGRYDIAIIPQDASKLGILLELKQVPALESSQLQEQLAHSASTALAQMELKRYDTELRQAGITNVCQIALAFCGKQFQLQYTLKTYP